MSAAEVGIGDFLLLMEDRLNRETANVADVLDCLDQVTEAFDRQLDPAVEFEAYAVMRFCKTMRQVLQRAG